MKNILLSIMILVSNREDTIECCLQSVVPLLNCIPSELIVVDTAGNKKCMEIVQHYTEKIVEFQWCDDFAAARNAGLSVANGDWIMILDDDEWFEDISEICEFFQKDIYRDYQSAAYIVRNYLDREGKNWNDGKVVRLSKLYPDSHYFGRIHEQLFPLEEPTYYMKTYVHHYGYVYETEEEYIRHCWRNIELLLICREEEPENWQAVIHLFREYILAGELFSAIYIGKELLDPNRYKNKRKTATAYIQVMMVSLWYRLGNYKEAYGMSLIILDESVTLFSKLCINALLPYICIRLNRQEEAIFYAESYFSLLDIWEKNVEENEQMDVFNIIGSYIEKKMQIKNQLLLFELYAEQGRWEEAERIFFQIFWKEAKEIIWILWEKTENIVSQIFYALLQFVLHTSGQLEYQEAFKIFLEKECFFEYIEKEIGKFTEEEKECIYYIILQINTQNKNIMEYQLQISAYRMDQVKINQILFQWQRQNYSFFLFQKETWRILDKLQISLYPYMQEISIYDWMVLSDSLFDLYSDEDCEHVYQLLTRKMEQGEFRILYLMGLRLEKKLLTTWFSDKKEYFSDNFEIIWQTIYRMASLWISCAAILYQESVFQSQMQSALPPKFRFAWWIFQANVVKADSRNFVRKVTEAAKAYIKMEEVCKFILKYYREKGE